MQAGSAPVMVLNQNMKRETGRKVQLQNVAAAKVRVLDVFGFGRRMTCVQIQGLLRRTHRDWIL